MFLSKKRIGEPKKIPWYVVKYVVITFAFFGLLAIFGGDKPSGEFRLDCGQYPDPFVVSNGRYIVKGTSDELRWEGLQPALQILDEVNPSVSEWVRELHSNGKIVYVETDGKLAKFGLYSRELKIYHGIYAECDGIIASVLCHEYRHSRQGINKILQYGFSFWRYKNGDDSILENDAYLYELEAVCIIFPVDITERNYQKDTLMAHIELIKLER